MVQVPPILETHGWMESNRTNAAAIASYIWWYMFNSVIKIYHPIYFFSSMVLFHWCCSWHLSVSMEYRYGWTKWEEYMIVGCNLLISRLCSCVRVVVTWTMREWTDFSRIWSFYYLTSLYFHLVALLEGGLGCSIEASDWPDRNEDTAAANLLLTNLVKIWSVSF